MMSSDSDSWTIVDDELEVIEDDASLSYTDFRKIIDRHSVSIVSAAPLDGDWIAVPTNDDLVAICRMPKENSDQLRRWKLFVDGRDPASIPRSELRREVYRGLNYSARQVLWVHWMRLEAPGRCPSQKQLDAFAEPEHSVIKQIGLDVPRTFPAVLSKADQKKLTKILHWYAGYRPEVGYCQSMNFIGAIFVLMGFEDRKCFAAVRALIDDFCSRYHVDQLEGLVRDVAVLDKFVFKLLPNMHRLLQELQVPLIWLAVDPFLCLFSKTLPLQSLLRLWDVYLFEGPRALFATFLAFLELHESYLRSAMSPSQKGGAAMQQVVQEFISTQVSADMDKVLQRTAHLLNTEVTNDSIKSFRMQVDAEKLFATPQVRVAVKAHWKPITYKAAAKAVTRR